ncbi:MAG TPA: hypothetical protein VKT52_12120, partial [Ktedonobacterales bacterium]|nr:hypothetical protein [Ktedonobacterales bacterium]
MRRQVLRRLSALPEMPRAASPAVAPTARLVRAFAAAGLWVMLACALAYVAVGTFVALGPRPAGPSGYT